LRKYADAGDEHRVVHGVELIVRPAIGDDDRAGGNNPTMRRAADGVEIGRYIRIFIDE